SFSLCIFLIVCFFCFMFTRPTTSALFPYTTLFRSGALTYTDIAGDPVLYGNLPPREISMKDVFRSGDSSKKFKIAEGQNGKHPSDRKSGSAGMPRPISYAVFCLKKKRDDIDPLRYI